MVTKAIFRFLEASNKTLILREPRFQQVYVVSLLLLHLQSFVFTNTGAMQRDPDHWDEPMAFRPERWEEPKVIAKLKENPYLYAVCYWYF